jgi:hypothetical protein
VTQSCTEINYRIYACPLYPPAETTGFIELEAIEYLDLLANTKADCPEINLLAQEFYI